MDITWGNWEDSKDFLEAMNRSIVTADELKWLHQEIAELWNPSIVRLAGGEREYLELTRPVYCRYPSDPGKRAALKFRLQALIDLALARKLENAVKWRADGSIIVIDHAGYEIAAHQPLIPDPQSGQYRFNTADFLRLFQWAANPNATILIVNAPDAWL